MKIQNQESNDVTLFLVVDDNMQLVVTVLFFNFLTVLCLPQGNISCIVLKLKIRFFSKDALYQIWDERRLNACYGTLKTQL